MNSKRRYFKQVRIAQFRAMLELARGKGFAAAACCWELGVGSWELGVGSWELGVGSWEI